MGERLLWLAGALVVLGGCHDFDALRRSGGGGDSAVGDADIVEASVDAPMEAGPPVFDCDACALGCATDKMHCKYFVPTHWSVAEAEKLGAVPDHEVVFSNDGGKYYMIITGESGDKTARVLRFDSERRIAQIPPDTTDFEVDSIPVSIIKVGGREVAAIVASKITVEENVVVRATGKRDNRLASRPVAFIASGDIEVLGTIDVGSQGLYAAAGADGKAAQGGASATGSLANGGAGGGNGTAGGASGVRAGGGVATDSPPPMARGGAGGNARDEKGGPIPGGAGGGVFQLVALGKITIGASAVLSAGGGGGTTMPSPVNITSVVSLAGGGGGGAGGAIFLDAPSLRVDGVVGAPGGGGGSINCNVYGCSTSSAEDGYAGRTSAAVGGVRGGTCAGGSGSDPVSGEAGDATNIGCGGGGGAGFVHILTKANGLNDAGATFRPDDRDGPGKLVETRDDLEVVE
ncbi:MAG: hypothetical protein KC417_16085 [Myxococcales bacterium]|nr:hypothetical protein [Myxococcales bacterium]